MKDFDQDTPAISRDSLDRAAFSAIWSFESLDDAPGTVTYDLADLRVGQVVFVEGNDGRVHGGVVMVSVATEGPRFVSAQFATEADLDLARADAAFAMAVTSHMDAIVESAGVAAMALADIRIHESVSLCDPSNMIYDGLNESEAARRLASAEVVLEENRQGRTTAITMARERAEQRITSDGQQVVDRALLHFIKFTYKPLTPGRVKVAPGHE